MCHSDKYTHSRLAINGNQKRQLVQEPTVMIYEKCYLATVTACTTDAAKSWLTSLPKVIWEEGRVAAKVSTHKLQ